MKILVMSLHRLGDVIMTTPILLGLKKQYPQAKLDLLMHSQFSNLSNMIDHVDNFIYFNYKDMQKGLGESDRSFFESYDRMEALIADLTFNDYDMTINLTHNRMSGWLHSLIPSKKKVGLAIDSQGQAHFGSQWFEYLNDVGSRQSEEAFHFIDIFYHGVGLSGSVRRINLKETEDGQAEAGRITSSLGNYICIQALTSDEKKNWGLNNWREMLGHMGQFSKGQTFVLLGAPAEEAQLRQLSAQLNQLNVKHCVAITSLEGAYSLLCEADLLITGDTGIKHMAVAAKTPIVEISIGSSSLMRTGAYSSKAIIIQTNEECAPCNHSSQCPYPHHPCAHRVAPEGVAMIAQSFLEKNEINLRTIAQEYAEEFSAYKADFSTTGDWNVYSITESFSKTSVMKWIDRSSQKLLFDKSTDENLLSFGTEGVNLSRLLASIFPEREKFTWIEVYKEIESDCSSFVQELEALMTELKFVIRDFDNDKTFENFKVRLERLCTKQNHRELFGSYILTLSDALNETLKQDSRFIAVKSMREILTFCLQRLQVESKIIRSLKNQTLEGI